MYTCLAAAVARARTHTLERVQVLSFDIERERLEVRRRDKQDDVIEIWVALFTSAVR